MNEDEKAAQIKLQVSVVLSNAVDNITNGAMNNVNPMQIVEEEEVVVLESIPAGVSLNATTTKPFIESNMSAERSLSQQEFYPPYA